jgi:adenine-specific DNA-methyltransferase
MFIDDSGAPVLDVIHHADALDLLRGLPDGCIDLVCTDPPYNGVKDDAWDNQWVTDADYLDWIGQLCQQWRRVLKPNGSIYVFATPRLASRVEVKIGEYFNVLNNIRWHKKEGWHNKASKEESRSYASPFEAVVFAEQYGDQYGEMERALHKDVYAPLGRYIQTERERAGVTRNQVEVALGFVSSSDPTRGTALCYRWEEGSSLPTEETYLHLRQYLNSLNGGEYLRRDYEELRRDYEELRRDYEELRRPFNVTDFDQYTDIWSFRTVAPYEGKHPAEKPLDLIKHIIKASSKAGAVVLDCFGGSGTTFDACRQLDRRYIGCDFDNRWVGYAKSRVEKPYTPLMFVE